MWRKEENIIPTFKEQRELILFITSIIQEAGKLLYIHYVIEYFKKILYTIGQKWVYSSEYMKQFILVIINYCIIFHMNCKPAFAPPCIPWHRLESVKWFSNLSITTLASRWQKENSLFCLWLFLLGLAYYVQRHMTACCRTSHHPYLNT